MTAQTYATDAAMSLLTKMGMTRTDDMKPTSGPILPVFVKQYRRCEVKCVVGPTWVTYYKLVKDTISDQDSVKTDDLESLRVELSKLMYLAKD